MSVDKLKNLENFSLTAEFTQKLSDWNDEDVGSLGGRIVKPLIVRGGGAVGVLFTTFLTTTGHLGFAILKTIPSPFVSAYNMLARRLERLPEASKGLEVSSVVVHVARAVESLVKGIFTSLLMLLDPTRAAAFAQIESPISYKRKLAQLNQDVESLQQQVDTLTRDLETAIRPEAIEQKEAEIARLQGSLAKKKSKIEDLKLDLECAEDEARKLKGGVNVLNNQGSFDNSSGITVVGVNGYFSPIIRKDPFGLDTSLISSIIGSTVEVEHNYETYDDLMPSVSRILGEETENSVTQENLQNLAASINLVQLEKVQPQQNSGFWDSVKNFTANIIYEEDRPSYNADHALLASVVIDLQETITEQRVNLLAQIKQGTELKSINHGPFLSTAETAFIRKNQNQPKILLSKLREVKNIIDQLQDLAEQVEEETVAENLNEELTESVMTNKNLVDFIAQFSDLRSKEDGLMLIHEKLAELELFVEEIEASNPDLFTRARQFMTGNSGEKRLQQQVDEKFKQLHLKSMAQERQRLTNAITMTDEEFALGVTLYDRLKFDIEDMPTQFNTYQEKLEKLIAVINNEELDPFRFGKDVAFRQEHKLWNAFSQFVNIVRRKMEEKTV